jgi:hypothetical protein
MSTPTATVPTPAPADEAHLAVQRHDADDDGMERYFAHYAIEHPEWCGTAVER